MRKKTERKKKTLRRICGFLLGIFACGFLINLYVALRGKTRIISPEAASGKAYDCILVLGCGVRADGQPSDMLADRLETAIELYKSGAGKKLLMSGDHGSTDYNEVQVMKDYAVKAGVPAEDIFMDHAGFCTYDSICRAKKVFGVGSVIIVTQRYHIFRALYLAEAFGMEAEGVCADIRSYRGALYREAREVIARNKDFIFGILKPDPAYLGELIPISGSGDVTDD